MPIIGQLDALKASSSVGSSGVANGSAVTTLALSQPMTAGERAAGKQNLVQAQLSINIGIGSGGYGYAPLYPSVPSYYGWMGSPYMVAPPPAPGWVILMHGGRYYRVPHHYWENRHHHWHHHHGRGW